MIRACIVYTGETILFNGAGLALLLYQMGKGTQASDPVKDLQIQRYRGRVQAALDAQEAAGTSPDIVAAIASVVDLAGVERHLREGDRAGAFALVLDGGPQS